MKTYLICISAIILNIFRGDVSCFGQKLVNIDLIKGCSFNGQVNTQKVYTFTPSDDAIGIIGKIVSEVGLKVNFVIVASTVDNACAITINGIRYIYYSESFMQQINLESHTNWAAVSILAHEVGHHLNGHTLDTSNIMDLRGQYELEADEFSGFILARFGASLSEAQSAIQTAIISNLSIGFYPPKNARLEAVAVGWKKGSKKVEGLESKKTEDPCEKNKIGSYCFTNSTNDRLKVIMTIEDKNSNSSSPNNSFDATIEPKATECFPDITATKYNYSVTVIVPDWPRPTINERPKEWRGHVVVEACKSKSTVIK